ncbi:DUF2294 domain-containing protein [Coleofasciculus sp. E2-BRE-01]|uniref:DUF2294 domain-containing protein n=1 Tax=Coleofasciculus sp. E2-BRE-01 TaxID=3069524 RepID=UPI0032F3CA2D
MSKKALPTRGQLERRLSQAIQSLYREQLGHQPSKITSSIEGNRVTLILEDAVTQPEQLLANQGEEALTQQVRSDLNAAIKPLLRERIQDVLAVEVVDLLSDTTLETKRLGIIAVLADNPQLRCSGSASKQPTHQAY